MCISYKKTCQVNAKVRNGNKNGFSPQNAGRTGGADAVTVHSRGKQESKLKQQIQHVQAVIQNLKYATGIQAEDKSQDDKREGERH